MGNIHDRERTYKVVLCSFGDGEVFKSSVERIRREAEESGWFDSVMVQTPKDLGPFWDEERQEYARNHRRGFGYYSYKARVILNAMESVEEGDVVTYVDGGCTINHHNPAARYRFLDYLELVRTSPAGVLCFQMPHLKEFDWNKENAARAVVASFSPGTDSEQDIDDLVRDQLNTGQILSGIILFRKCQSSLELLRRWQSFLEDKSGRHLIDDSPSSFPNTSSFQEHRHDQSIFSLCAKMTSGVVLLDDETWVPDNDWHNAGAWMPFQATRLRC